MKEHFLNLIAYNQWANRRLLPLLEHQNIMNNRVFLLFSHLLEAEQVWLYRALNVAAPTAKLWEVKEFPKLQELVDRNASQWKELLEKLDFAQALPEVEYKNSRGEQFTNSLADIITHMVIHGSHHRGQILQLLKLENIEVIPLDYIAWVRKK